MATERLGETTQERRPAVWPWLLVPLVALAMFFALHRLRDTLPEAAPPAAPAVPAPAG